MLLAEAIKRNRIREARYNRAERVLRAVRLRVFDYEDAGLYDKALKVIRTCKRILEPRWYARQLALQNQKLQQTPSAFEPGACGHFPSQYQP